jgi:hypothetical protein
MKTDYGRDTSLFIGDLHLKSADGPIKRFQERLLDFSGKVVIASIAYPASRQDILGIS